jgi:hypothetical protein
VRQPPSQSVPNGGGTDILEAQFYNVDPPISIRGELDRIRQMSYLSVREWMTGKPSDIPAESQLCMPPAVEKTIAGRMKMLQKKAGRSAATRK